MCNTHAVVTAIPLVTATFVVTATPDVTGKTTCASGALLGCMRRAGVSVRMPHHGVRQMCRVISHARLGHVKFLGRFFIPKTLGRHPFYKWAESFLTNWPLLLLFGLSGMQRC